MKRMIALLLLVCMCTSLSACDLVLMSRNPKTTTVPQTTAATKPTFNVPKVEEITPGVAEINNCQVEIDMNLTRLMMYWDQRACMVQLTFQNNRSQATTMNSVCKVMVFQGGKLCKEITLDAAGVPDSMKDGADVEVQPGKSWRVSKYYAVNNSYDPIEIQIRYNGDVVTKITYDPRA